MNSDVATKNIEQVNSISLGESCSVLSKVLSMAQNKASSLDDISTYISNYSLPITNNFIRYANSNSKITLGNGFEGKKIQSVNEGLMVHGLNPLIYTILNTGISNPKMKPFLQRAEILGRNVCSLLENFYPPKGILDSKVSVENRYNAQTYALLFGIDLLVFLDASLKKESIDKRYISSFEESMSCKFKYRAHQHTKKLDKHLLLPSYLKRGEESTEPIENTSFTNYEVMQAMNLKLGIEGIGILDTYQGESEIIVSPQRMEKSKSRYELELDELIKKNIDRTGSNHFSYVKTFEVSR